ncbi:polysaccharide deacetylase family protein [Anaerolentibacter hominis]|uniref:polysaccharide deacetylase family protein n=1 Tax=Anaerolentibacter hominis TaxID=3079009 RepID=UPI0031B821CE
MYEGRKRKNNLVIVLLIFFFVETAFFIFYAFHTQKAQNRLTSTLEETTASVGSLHDEAEDLNKQNSELSGQVAQLTDELDSMTQSKEEVDDYVVRLKDQVSDLKKSVNKGGSKVPDIAAPGYESKYPSLYASEMYMPKVDRSKVVYLTFDDGPSDLTPEILDILDEYNVKATFFVIQKTQQSSVDAYNEIVKRGHSLAIHTASHVYTQIYASVSAYLKDFNTIYNYLEEKTGVRCRIFRFPGGSVNSYNKNYYNELIDEMERRGFVYFDWNVDSGDARGKATAKEIKKNVLDEVHGKTGASIVLMHDTNVKQTTVEALPEIIKTLQDEGYTFRVLDENVKPIQFKR